MRQRRQWRAAVVAAAAVAASTACGGQAATPEWSGDCPATADGPVTLVVGARMGSPKPILPGVVVDLIAASAAAGQQLRIVRVDGQPSVAVSAKATIDGRNESKRAQQVETVVQQVKTVLAQLMPKAAEADVLGAVAEAARVTPEGGTVVLVDSGLATAGSLSFLEDGMFGAEPADVAEFLAVGGLLPKLSGRAVLLVGLGGTADPQPALDQNLRTRVAALWRGVVERSGAKCVEEVEVPSRRDAVDVDQSVTVVPLPQPPKLQACGTTVLQDSDSVGFVANKADLRDPTAAEATLRELADLVKAGTQRITLVGNTARWGPEPGNRDLSQRRASTVKAALVRFGVAAERITTRGDGSTGPYHQEDLGPGGVLIPAVAALNRSVVVELAC
ncbi:OmpA family protein [Actinokineospora sp. 24-640]